MCSGRYTVSIESHCDCALIVKSHSQQCRIQWKVPQSFWMWQTHADWPTLHDSDKITPRTSLHSAYSRLVGFKINTHTKWTLHYNLSSPVLLTILTPWGTNQSAKRLPRQFTAYISKNFSVDFEQVQRDINQTNMHFGETVKKQTYALNPSELMLLSVLTI